MHTNDLFIYLLIAKCQNDAAATISYSYQYQSLAILKFPLPLSTYPIHMDIFSNWAKCRTGGKKNNTKNNVKADAKSNSSFPAKQLD